MDGILRCLALWRAAAGSFFLQDVGATASILPRPSSTYGFFGSLLHYHAVIHAPFVIVMSFTGRFELSAPAPPGAKEEEGAFPVSARDVLFSLNVLRVRFVGCCCHYAPCVHADKSGVVLVLQTSPATGACPPPLWHERRKAKNPRSHVADVERIVDVKPGSSRILCLTDNARCLEKERKTWRWRYLGCVVISRITTTCACSSSCTAFNGTAKDSLFIHPALRLVLPFAFRSLHAFHCTAAPASEQFSGCISTFAMTVRRYELLPLLSAAPRDLAQNAVGSPLDELNDAS